MASLKRLLVIGVILLVCWCAFVKCEEEEEDEIDAFLGRQLEEGRTFVHHAMKRLAVLLPAFMFKLGVMFTMMLVTTITSVKGMLVGTLLLALGIGHFIASKFATSTPTAYIAQPHYAAAYHAAPGPHWVDRSDNLAQAQPTGYAQGQAYGAWKMQ